MMNRSLKELKDYRRNSNIYVLGAGVTIDYFNKDFFNGDLVVIGCNRMYKSFPVSFTITMHPEIAAEVIRDGQLLIAPKHYGADTERPLSKEEAHYIYITIRPGSMVTLRQR